jgi:hypothetical protein
MDLNRLGPNDGMVTGFHPLTLFIVFQHQGADYLSSLIQPGKKHVLTKLLPSAFFCFFKNIYDFKR